MGSVLGELGKYAEGLDYLEHSLKLQEAQNGNNHLLTALSYQYLGYVQALAGYTETARDNLECARKIYQAQQPEHFNHARTLTYLGDVLIKMKDYETAHLCLERALAIRRHDRGFERLDMGITRVVMGTLEEAAGHPGEALMHFESAHGIFEGVVAPTHRYYVRAKEALARCDRLTYAPGLKCG